MLFNVQFITIRNLRTHSRRIPIAQTMHTTLSFTILFSYFLLSLLAPTIWACPNPAYFPSAVFKYNSKELSSPVYPLETKASTNISTGLSDESTNTGTKDEIRFPTPEITHMNLLWGFITLILAYVTHPFSKPRFREWPQCQVAAVLLLPIEPVFDVVDLFRDIIFPPSHSSIHCKSNLSILHELKTITPWQAVDYAISIRLGGVRPKESKVDVRTLLSIISILQFIKIYGYKNIGYGFIWATFLFIPWLILEALYYLPTPRVAIACRQRHGYLCTGWRSDLNSCRFKALSEIATILLATFVISGSLVLFVTGILATSFGIQTYSSLVWSCYFTPFVICVLGFFRKSYSLLSLSQVTFLNFTFYIFSGILHVMSLLYFFLIFDLTHSTKEAWTEMLP